MAAFFLRDLHEAMLNKFALVTQVGGLVLGITTLSYLCRFVEQAGTNAALRPYGSSYLGFVLLGFVVTELQQVLSSSFSRRIRDAQLAGTLESVLASRAKAWQVVLAAPTGDIVRSALRMLLYGWVATAGFGLRFHGARWGVALGALVLSLFAFSGFGLLGAAAVMVLRRSDPVSMGLASLSVLLGGVMYPISMLPGWLQQLASWLPMVHGLEVLRRSLLTGAGLVEVMPSLARLAGLSGAILVVGGWAFRAALSHARRDGSLTHY
jgi:ABC-2 type transport system permease protein